MTLLLVLHILTSDGKDASYNMALFTNEADCRMAGSLVAKHLTKSSNGDAFVLYTCEPTN